MFGVVFKIRDLLVYLLKGKVPVKSERQKKQNRGDGGTWDSEHREDVFVLDGRNIKLANPYFDD